MMGARHVVVPARQYLRGVLLILRRQWGSKPAIRQRMLMAEAFGQVVERYDIGKAKPRKRPLDRHIRRHDETDREADLTLGALRTPHRDGAALCRPMPGPAPAAGIAVDDEDEIMPHGL